jgi:hypothetical protein
VPPPSIAARKNASPSARPLTAKEAAERLGISATTFYGWLGLSDQGLLVIRGESITIDYCQGGPRGQGKILIDAAEVVRLKETMRVRPLRQRPRRHPTSPGRYPGITVPLGQPD